MSDLTPEELALLAEAERTPAVARKARKHAELKHKDEDAEAPAPAPARGPHTPVQYADDGWADLPIQMRG